MVPLNLLHSKKTADYVNTGAWSKKAIQEARRFCQVNVAASSEAQRFTCVPPRAEWHCQADTAYLHYTHNETIGGVEFNDIPESAVPLVSDMSSTLLSRPLPIERFGLIYAGAQKNIGPAGLTIVIVREDLIGQALPGTGGCSAGSWIGPFSKSTAAGAQVRPYMSDLSLFRRSFQRTISPV